MEAIYEVGGKLDLVITLDDNQAVSKSGRVYLDDFCTEQGVPLLKSSNINNEECVQALKEFDIDWLFIIGWSQIAKSEILSAPKKGVLGIHPTLLPVGRGRAAIPWAILKGLDKTGVTLFKLDQGVDTGDILDQLVIPLKEDVDAAHLYQEVNEGHVTLIKKAMSDLQADKAIFTKQDESKATEWLGRKPSDGEIDLDGSVCDAERLVRAVTKPYPGAYVIKEGVKYIIWAARIAGSGEESLAEAIKFKDGVLLPTDIEKAS